MKQQTRRSRVFISFVAMGALSAWMGCSRSEPVSRQITAANWVQSGDPGLVRTIGDSLHTFEILGQSAFHLKTIRGEILKTEAIRSSVGPNSVAPNSVALNSGGNDSSSDANSLVFGLPMNLLNKPMVFGSVITQVSDSTNQNLGDLKLADIPPFQVILISHRIDPRHFVVSVVDCGADCNQLSNQEPLFDIPVTGINSDKKFIYLDLASLGQGLDLTSIRKGDPTLTQFKSKSSQTVRFDYSNNTLVFDVEAHLVNVHADPSNPAAPQTIITNRWYFSPETPFNSKFNARAATPGVGFFMTDESEHPLIQRWDFDQRGLNDGIQYYIKNVPQEYHAVFAKSFDEWNRKLLPLIGKKIFTYEFIQPGDPRQELLIAGDVRYNILEWDLANRATYGGLGPSLANQYTGEIFHANVLVQGPQIIELYSKWFRFQTDASRLMEIGRSEEAQRLLVQASRELKGQVLATHAPQSFQLKLGQQVSMRVRSQEPALEDPLMPKDSFDPIPRGYTFESYMEGYFLDMLLHEEGHNLGLRHNFRGSLGATAGTPVLGGVSRSVMEYLGKSYRYLDQVGEYDLMALAYGYLGVQPSHTDWYCTDEDSADLNDPQKSAECTPSDATEDPFSFFQGQLARASELLLAKGKPISPDWTVEDMKDPLKVAVEGLGTYAVSALKTSDTWTNFFNKLDRPSSASGVKPYVLSKIKEIICNSADESEIATKPTTEAKAMAQANRLGLRARVAEILAPVFSSEDLKCSHPGVVLD